MLAKNALAIKMLKKKLYLGYSKLIGRYKKVIWHVSTEHEKKEVIDVFGSNSNVKIAMNMPGGKVDFKERIKIKGEVKMYFLSRIAIKKNLLFALQLLSRVNNKYSITYDIYGPVDENNYWEECQMIIKELPENITVNYKGAINHNTLGDVLTGYHFFLLPTLNENYGHVIVEAFNFGCPVIISDNTPWKSLENKGAGWEIDLDNQKEFIKVVEKCADLDQKEFNELSKSTYDFGVSVLQDPSWIKENHELFLKA